MTDSVAGIAELARRHRLVTGEDALGCLLGLLSQDPRAPTSVRDPKRVLDDHLADSLSALELERLMAARNIVDVGSGAGLPALPLAVALPDAAVVALESSSRKTEFISHAITHCGIANARAVSARAEAWPEGREGADLVTARALASLAVVVEYAAPLLRKGGALVAWRGRRDPREEDDAAAAAATLGMEPEEVRAVRPYERALNRHLHVFAKVDETPARFPRRPGVARKRPLAAK